MTENVVARLEDRVSELVARVSELEGWVTARDERIACLEDELAEAREGL